MKKVLVCMLAALLLLTALTGCGEREKKDIGAAKSIADLSGAIIGAQSGTFHYDALEQISGVEKRSYSDFTDLLNALRSGAIDGYVAEEPTAYVITGEDSTLSYLPFVNNETGFAATANDTGIAVAFKTGSAYVPDVNVILSGISEQTRTALMQQMFEIGMNHENTLSAEPVLVSSNTSTENGTLKIAMECAYTPFNWTQTDDKNGAVAISSADNMYANGYDVQIAKYIAAELGMSLEIYAYEWDSLIPAVQSGAVDGIIAGMSPTAEREAEVDFTDCYYSSNLVVIIKKA